MRSALLLVILTVSCATPVYRVTALRTTYTGPEKLEIDCATFANGDEKDLNKKLGRVYAGGWRIASAGSVDGDFFFCFERPAGAKAVASHASRPATREETRPREEPAPASEDAASGTKTDEAPSAAPSSEATAPAEDSTTEAPPEKPKRRHPIDADPGNGQ